MHSFGGFIVCNFVKIGQINLLNSTAIHFCKVHPLEDPGLWQFTLLYSIVEKVKQKLHFEQD